MNNNQRMMNLFAERYRLMQEVEEIIVSGKMSQKLDRLIEIDCKVRQLNKKILF